MQFISWEVFWTYGFLLKTNPGSLNATIFEEMVWFLLDHNLSPNPLKHGDFFFGIHQPNKNAGKNCSFQGNTCDLNSAFGAIFLEVLLPAVRQDIGELGSPRDRRLDDPKVSL